MRQDLVVSLMRVSGVNMRVVKDPVTLAHYSMSESDYVLLTLFDGKRSLRDIQDEYAILTDSESLNIKYFERFQYRTFREHLLVGDSTGQGGTLCDHRRRKVLQDRLERWANPLAIRLRGFDPDRLLTWMCRRMGWLFHPWVGAGIAALILSAILLIITNFAAFKHRLPSINELATYQGVLASIFALCLLKTIHEFGHGLACKRLGGECHEMGVMFLVGIPCLYCNVSDAWLFPNKWHRAMTGAAGIIVEVTIASIAAFIWWNTSPGTLRLVAFSIMMVGSVSTIVTNGNPLLRYDGYYVLSDLVEVPNLWQRAMEDLRARLPRPRHGSRTNGPYRGSIYLSLYAISALVYRCLVAVCVSVLILKLAHRWHLVPLGMLMCSATAFAFFGIPIVQGLRKLLSPLNTDGRSPKIVSVVGLCAILALVLVVPLPATVRIPCTVEPVAAGIIFAEVPGRLEEVLVRPGDYVAVGTPLARLASPTIELELVRLESQRSRCQEQCRTLLHRVLNDANAVDELASARETLASLDEMLSQKRQEAQRLTILATVEGRVLDVTHHRDRQKTSDVELREWRGSLFDRENLGCHVERGTSFCQIACSDCFEIRGLAPQTHVGLIEVGHAGHIYLAAYPATVFEGYVLQVSQADLSRTPGHQPSQAPLASNYQIRVSLSANNEALCNGITGFVDIACDSRSILSRAVRWCGETFEFSELNSTSASRL